MTINIRGCIRKIINRIPKRAVLLSALSGISILIITLTGLSVNTVLASNGEETVKFKSFHSDSKTLLAMSGLSYSDTQIYKTSQNKVIKLSVKGTFPVKINYNNKKYSVNIVKGTKVSEILDIAGIELGKYDIINVKLNEKIYSSETIDIIHIDYITESLQETANFKMETVYTNTMNEGTEKTTSGKNGLKTVTYERKLVNGEISESKVVSEKIITSPVNQITYIGTKKEGVSHSNSVSTISKLTPETAIVLDENGNPVNYKKHVTVQATAYTAPAGKHCSTGVVAAPGYIAVNPKVIPYGTKMYIKSSDGTFIYGYAVAADTGGFARRRPTNVDLFFSSEYDCTKFGRRNVEIYFLD